MLRTPMMTAMFARMPELSQYTVAIVYAAIMLPRQHLKLKQMGIKLFYGRFSEVKLAFSCR